MQNKSIHFFIWMDSAYFLPLQNFKLFCTILTFSFTKKCIFSIQCSKNFIVELLSQWKVKKSNSVARNVILNKLNWYKLNKLYYCQHEPKHAEEPFENVCLNLII